MIAWRCSYCGTEAWYHACIDEGHKFYCHKHWVMWLEDREKLKEETGHTRMNEVH
jgi:hypothetical protein